MIQRRLLFHLNPPRDRSACMRVIVLLPIQKKDPPLETAHWTPSPWTYTTADACVRSSLCFAFIVVLRDTGDDRKQPWITSTRSCKSRHSCSAPPAGTCRLVVLGFQGVSRRTSCLRMMMLMLPSRLRRSKTRSGRKKVCSTKNNTVDCRRTPTHRSHQVLQTISIQPKIQQRCLVLWGLILTSVAIC